MFLDERILSFLSEEFSKAYATESSSSVQENRGQLLKVANLDSQKCQRREVSLDAFQFFRFPGGTNHAHIHQLTGGLSSLSCRNLRRPDRDQRSGEDAFKTALFR